MPVRLTPEQDADIQNCVKLVARVANAAAEREAEFITLPLRPLLGTLAALDIAIRDGLEMMGIDPDLPEEAPEMTISDLINMHTKGEA